MVVPLVAVHQQGVTLQGYHLVVGYRDFLLCQLDVGRQCNVVDAMPVADVFALQAIDDGSAHNGNLVLGFLNQGIGIYQAGAHVKVELNGVAFLPFAGEGDGRQATVHSGRLAIDGERIRGAPVGDVEHDSVEPFGLFDGELFLTERIKDLFKTSNGKYIAPQMIESKLLVDKYIDQIAIIADQRKFVSALIVPVYNLLEEYARAHNIAFETREQLCQAPQIMEMMKERIDTLQQQLAHYEQVKRFTLLPNHLSMEKGELTNTLKIRRRVLNENYKDEINKMYAE